MLHSVKRDKRLWYVYKHGFFVSYRRVNCKGQNRKPSETCFELLYIYELKTKLLVMVRLFYFKNQKHLSYTIPLLVSQNTFNDDGSGN